MARLMKAEWYRIRHSHNIVKWLVFICVVLAVIPLADLKLKTASEYMFKLTEASVMFVPLFIMVFSSVIIGFLYLNKTGLYEVMAGNNINHIIMSKIVVDATFISAMVSITYVAAYTVIGIIKGWGSLDNIVIRFLMLFIIFFHISACGILIMMSFRQMAGVVICFLKADILDASIPIWLEFIFKGNISDSIYKKMMNWFPMYQIMEVVRGRITIYLAGEIILSLVVELVFWYFISYYGMKKRNY